MLELLKKNQVSNLNYFKDKMAHLFIFLRKVLQYEKISTFITRHGGLVTLYVIKNNAQKIRKNCVANAG